MKWTTTEVQYEMVSNKLQSGGVVGFGADGAEIDVHAYSPRTASRITLFTYLLARSNRWWVESPSKVPNILYVYEAEQHQGR